MTETIVIKVGGHASKLLDDQFYHQLAKWRAQEKHVLIIHGGGPQISQWLDLMKLPNHKEDGVRVTTPACLEVIQAVLLGVVQPALCHQLTTYHLPVVGLNTNDHHLLAGNYLDQPHFGEVGQITGVNQAWLDQLLTNEIGVLAPLAQTASGQLLNVNADTAAAEIATRLGASKLVLLTDVPGVLKAGKVLPRLDQTGANQLFAHHQITAGMMPKLTAAFSALKRGVANVSITNDLTQSGTALAHQVSA
ncbi:acetylglutamate kinase [Limosilactobacillus fermentum]|uniref:acetylglutamate kinase n=1 Tax=Limosilactobacillus fermentum TaxID=1613 RepID=UPI0006BA2FC3|nr:acetylglutamate kinase [Limosilactobacillus fermentum]